MKYLKLFYDFAAEIEDLTMEERGRLLTAMLGYGGKGRVPEGLLTGNERFLFPVCRQRIDRDAESYDRRVESNRANGIKGGRPRKNPTGYSETEKTQDKDKDQDKDQDQDKEKDKDKGEGEDRGGPTPPAPPLISSGFEPRGEGLAKDDRPLPPTCQQVADLCKAESLAVDPAKFWYYYQANGWRAGSLPILDWRAKLREWDARERGFAPRATDRAPANAPDPMNYQQREYREEDFGDAFYLDVVGEYGKRER